MSRPPMPPPPPVPYSQTSEAQKARARLSGARAEGFVGGLIVAVLLIMALAVSLASR